MSLIELLERAAAAYPDSDWFRLLYDNKTGEPRYLSQDGIACYITSELYLSFNPNATEAQQREAACWALTKAIGKLYRVMEAIDQKETPCEITVC